MIFESANIFNGQDVCEKTKHKQTNKPTNKNLCDKNLNLELLDY